MFVSCLQGTHVHLWFMSYQHKVLGNDRILSYMVQGSYSSSRNNRRTPNTWHRSCGPSGHVMDPYEALVTLASLKRGKRPEIPIAIAFVALPKQLLLDWTRNLREKLFKHPLKGLGSLRSWKQVHLPQMEQSTNPNIPQHSSSQPSSPLDILQPCRDSLGHTHTQTGNPERYEGLLASHGRY